MKKLIVFLICFIFSLSLSAQSKIEIVVNNTMIVNKETRVIVAQGEHAPVHIIIDVANHAVFFPDSEQPEYFHKFDILKTRNPEKNVWGYMLHDRYIVLDLQNKEFQMYLNKSENVTVNKNIDITFH